ncbi:PD-(D/E)XK motif protein [Cobetia marina]|uniref:PD-(D/E)XK motif protein n=1 Tax=Cobetia marina TaxID=28258 RepID=UPI0011446689|nr:PD-(D/E)XK motif protein [Cobetia marina]GED42430.1 hypothetical protein HHA02_17590 [Cobetia marina]
MNTIDPWTDMKPGIMRRVDSTGLYPFFWVKLEEESVGLLFIYSAKLELPIKIPKFKNISVQIQTRGSERALVIILNDNSFRKMFVTFCQDVVNTSSRASSVEEAVLATIRCTNKWHYFLKNGKDYGLALNEQRGLVGELDFLIYMSNLMSPKQAIEAWQGPMGAAKDFEFPGFCVEIKTRRAASQPVVSISSEHQLEEVDSSNLYLRVTSVSSGAGPEGMTLHELVKQADRIFQVDDSTHDQWQSAIIATGYDPINDYEDRHWEVVGYTEYFIGTDFPRLIPPLPKGISRLSYSLALEDCVDHIIPGIHEHFFQEGNTNG